MSTCLTSSTPAHSPVLPVGTPIQRMTPYTVTPVLDVTSTMEPTSRRMSAGGGGGGVGLWLGVMRWSTARVSPAGHPRTLPLEWTRDTAFWPTTGVTGAGITRTVTWLQFKSLHLMLHGDRVTGLHPRYAPEHEMCTTGSARVPLSILQHVTRRQFFRFTSSALATMSSI